MRAVAATAVIRPDHVLTVPVPADIPPGEHQVVVVLEEISARERGGFCLADWPPPHDIGPVDPAMTFRREDIYGDDGR